MKNAAKCEGFVLGASDRRCRHGEFFLKYVTSFPSLTQGIHEAL